MTSHVPAFLEQFGAMGSAEQLASEPLLADAEPVEHMHTLLHWRS